MMLFERVGDIWDYHDRGFHIVIPTNGSVKKNGALVMGRGLAKQASERYTSLPKFFGQRIQTWGNRVQCHRDYGIFAFPVKHLWNQSADIALIRRSAEELANLVDRFGHTLHVPPATPVVLPRVGCGNGKLEWPEVHATLSDILDERFFIVDNLQGE